MAAAFGVFCPERLVWWNQGTSSESRSREERAEVNSIPSPGTGHSALVKGLASTGIGVIANLSLMLLLESQMLLPVIQSFAKKKKKN